MTICVLSLALSRCSECSCHDHCFPSRGGSMMGEKSMDLGAGQSWLQRPTSAVHQLRDFKQLIRLFKPFQPVKQIVVLHGIL